MIYKESPEMLDYHSSLSFSNTHSNKRLEKAYKYLGANVVNRIIGFALFLLGANRKDIAQYLKIPFGTFISFLTRIVHFGIPAFGDRRSTSSLQPQKIETPLKVSLTVKDQNVCIQLGGEGQTINIPSKNSLQMKTVLLTLLNNGLISTKETSQTLGLSTRHTTELSAKMQQNDVHSLIDKRKGQLKYYRYTPEIKAELIQQFAANAISGQPTSSHVITEQINKRCNLNLSDRSIRLHIQKLGLRKIARSLPKLVDSLKKNSLPMLE